MAASRDKVPRRATQRTEAAEPALPNQSMAGGTKKNCSSIPSDQRCSSGLSSAATSKYPVSDQSCMLLEKNAEATVCRPRTENSGADKTSQPALHTEIRTNARAGKMRLARFA